MTKVIVFITAELGKGRKAAIEGALQGKSLSCKSYTVLRQAQHERKSVNLFDAHTVRLELVER